MVGAGTVGAALAARVAADPTSPLLTFYDDGTGERTELSGATLSNWVSKIANLAVDSGLSPGDRASIGLPPHWQSAAVLLGCWSAGLVVVDGPAPSEIAFAHVDAATPGWPAAERYALDLHPFALPMRAVPDGYADFGTEVRGHGDHFVPIEPVEPGSGALVDGERAWSHSALLADAAERAGRLGIAGGRVLIDADAHPDPRDWLLAPLVGGASIVLCRRAEVARLSSRATSERVTVRVD